MNIIPFPAQQFVVYQSEDHVKTDLELTCTVCRQVLCDVEHNDDLIILVAFAIAHIKACPGDEDDTGE
ncbi:hypothetical protein [Acrocarpospora sp. B8E8]|uniref:hypothetical protein n=1 Tax=Acrocarpospora sp. B8E8 TaxID=3153572 RepID=UPI00325C9F33